MPFGSTAAHDPVGLEILRVEVEIPDVAMNKKMIGMNIQGQTINSMCLEALERALITI
ncbi:MAG TPA: hypothetical protein VNL13_07020 [Sulfolobales archaeon]|nr:hypothetical protein [Sulfolobales archaeon]